MHRTVARGRGRLKLVAITAIGTYFSPWFAPGLASIYNAVDEIVVVNNGFRLDVWPPDTGPLLKVFVAINELDVNGKVHKLTCIDPQKLRHGFQVGTQYDANRRRQTWEGEGPWYDMRGLNLTAAMEYAVDKLGAEWVLKYDSDQVCHPDGLEHIKQNLVHPVFFRQDEFVGDIGPTPPWHLFIPASPWIDTVEAYPASPDLWYVGGGAIAGLKGARYPQSRFRCAHLRGANPAHLTHEEKLEHFTRRRAWQLYTNDVGAWTFDLMNRAKQDAIHQLMKVETLSSDVYPPEACLTRDLSWYVATH